MGKQRFDPIEWLTNTAIAGKMPTIVRGDECNYISMPPLPPKLLKQFSRHSKEIIEAISKFKMI